jgi:anti-anti-sigma regulatory factor
MLTLDVENLGDLAIIECRGRIVHSKDVFKLRDIVRSQTKAGTIVLDLSEVKSVGGGGIGMLAFLQHWAQDHEIKLKLYSPSSAVLDELMRNCRAANFEIPSLHEMMAILADAEGECRLAA